MKIETVSISSLKLDPKNARKHNKKNLDAIKGSLKTFGQQKPIVVDKSGTIIAGNGTFEAAKSLGWQSIGVVTTDLKGTAAKAFALADNRAGELAEWDIESLDVDLKSLVDIGFNLADIGFDESFVNAHFRTKETDDDDPDPAAESESEKELVLRIVFENEDDQQALFLELRDRGFKVKV